MNNLNMKHTFRLFRSVLNIRVIAGMIAFLSVIVLLMVLSLARDILIPMFTAWFISQILRPVNELGKKLHMHQYLNLVLMFTVLIASLVLGVRFLAGQAIAVNNAYNRYAPVFMQRIRDILALLNITPEMLAEMISAVNWGTIGLDFLKSSAAPAAGFLMRTINSFIMTMLFLMFLLVEAPNTEKKINKAFQGKAGSSIKTIFHAISDQISHYIINQTLLSGLTAVLVWVILAIFRVEIAGGWAMLAFFLNFIPNVGSVIATIFPSVMAFIQFPTLLEPVTVFVLITAVQVIIGNIIGPRY